MKQIRFKWLVALLTCFIVITSASLSVQAEPGKNQVGIELKEKTKETVTTTSTTTTSTSSTTSQTTTTTSTVTPTQPVTNKPGPTGMIKYLPQTDEATPNHWFMIAGVLLVLVSGLLFWNNRKKVSE